MSDYRDCAGCYRPMRTAHTSLTDHPGTILYYSQGYCRPCYRSCGIAALPKNEKQPTTDIDVRATMASLMAYHQWRKPFRAKAGQS